MKRAPGPARKATVSAMTVGLAASPSTSMRFSAASVSPNTSSARVPIIPGAIALTNMPRQRSSLAIARVIATTPAFAAA